MFIVGLLSWWYGAGWRGRAAAFRNKLAGTMDYFSIDLLLRTLFSPFRQISAGNVNGSLSVQMHAFFDQLISRVIGAFVRSIMIIIGVMTLIVYGLIGLGLLILWAFIPLFPGIGLVLMLKGWMPWM